MGTRRGLVTGVGKGIGRVIARTLAESGAEVFGISRTQDDLDSLAKEVPAIHTINVDLGNWAATRKAVEDIGPIHLLVNNAAIFIAKPFFDVSEEDLHMQKPEYMKIRTRLLVSRSIHCPEQVQNLFWNRSQSVNINGIINVSQVVAKGMVERAKGGAIVNISSVAAHLALNHAIAYNLTKGALTSMTQSMALELAPHKVRVNNVEPTLVMTPMAKMYWGDNPRREPFLARHPMGCFVEEEDIASATMFLLSEAASMITGTSLRVDAGVMCN